MLVSVSGAIIAAGRGERLRPAVGELPKPLVEIGGQTLLERQIGLMLNAGLSPVHVIVNSETARLAAARGLKFHEDVVLSVADTPNSMESLLRLGEQIRSEGFILATVDSVIPRHDFMEFVERSRAAIEAHDGCDGMLGICRWQGDERPLFVTRSSSGFITSFGEQEQPWVTAGIYSFNSRIFDLTDAARQRGLNALRRFLALLLEHGMRLKGHELSKVVDLDSGDELAQAKAWLEDAASAKAGR